MKKNIWILLVIISVVVFSFDNSYAFFGKRKDSAETESVEKVEEKAVEVEKKVEKKVAKKVVKKTNKSKGYILLWLFYRLTLFRHYKLETRQYQ